MTSPEENEKWLDREVLPGGVQGPGDLLLAAIAVGIVSGVLGAVLFNGDDLEWVGLTVWIVGGTASSLIALVAVIAMGVAMGLRVARERGDF